MIGLAMRALSLCDSIARNRKNLTSGGGGIAGYEVRGVKTPHT